MLTTMVFFLAVSVFGICTGVGLLGRKNWARISTLVWAGIAVPMSAFTILMFALIPIPTLPNSPGNFVYFFRVFSVLFYGTPLAIGVWWLILFNRKAIVAEFTSRDTGGEATLPDGTSQPLSPVQPSLPLPIAVLGWFFLFSSTSFGFIFLMHIPAVLFGFAIRGPAGMAVYAIWALLYVAAGVGLLKRIRWSLSLARTSSLWTSKRWYHGVERQL